MEEDIQKPVILAICGKSATGKDSLAMWLKRYLGRKVPTHAIVSHTTRPPRPDEKDGIDYTFISENEFMNYKAIRHYLEWTKFRDWYYATPKSELMNQGINIGVFNPEGLEALKEFENEFLIIPIYLDNTLTTRLKRSIEREYKFRFEFLRRAFVDWLDFRKIKKYLNNNFKRSMILKDYTNVLQKGETVVNMLNNWKILDFWTIYDFYTRNHYLGKSQ